MEVGKNDKNEPEWGLGFSSSDTTSHCSPDPVMGAKFIKDIYQKYCPSYKGKYTVPVLFDKKLSIIVNNDSADLMQILNSAFNKVAKHPEIDFYPMAMEQVLNKTLTWSIQTLLMVPLQAGTATTQQECNARMDVAHLD